MTAKAGGVAALQRKPRLGLRAKVTDAQKHQLVAWLTEGVEVHGYAANVWALKRVAAFIQQRFGVTVTYHSSTMSDLLRDLDWTWQQARWPEIAKKAEDTARSSS